MFWCQLILLFLLASTWVGSSIRALCWCSKEIDDAFAGIIVFGLMEFVVTGIFVSSLALHWGAGCFSLLF